MPTLLPPRTASTTSQVSVGKKLDQSPFVRQTILVKIVHLLLRSAYSSQLAVQIHLELQCHMYQYNILYVSLTLTHGLDVVVVHIVNTVCALTPALAVGRSDAPKCRAIPALRAAKLADSFGNLSK